MVHDIATNELCPQERVEVGPGGAGQSSLLAEEESSQIQGHPRQHSKRLSRKQWKGSQ